MLSIIRGTRVLSADVWTKAAAESNPNKRSSTVSCRLCLSSYQHNTSSLAVIRPYANQVFSLLSDEQRGNPGIWRIILVLQWSVATLQFFLQSLVWMCVCVSHLQPSLSAELCSVCFTVNAGSVLTRAAYCTVLTGCVYRDVFVCSRSRAAFLRPNSFPIQGNCFRLMFVVNSWVYLGERRHVVIVRHRIENAEQVLLFLWNKRGRFCPFPKRWLRHLFKSLHLCFLPSSTVTLSPSVLSVKHCAMKCS